MKKHLLFMGVIAFALNACGPVYVVRQPAPPPASAPAEPPPADAEDVSYQTFYDQLSPYGQWIEDPDYGYVWMPNVNSDFKPYSTNGNWVYTDEGWAWDSGYPWGWAAFHYGRWFFKDGYGWMWMPGNEWAPAWVSWRNSDDYYGWAPLGPSIGLNAAYDGGYNPPSHYWCFVPHRYIASPQVSNYYVRETNNITIINHTTIISNTTMAGNQLANHPRNPHYGYGPDPNEVGRYTGSPLHPIPVHENRTPGRQTATSGFAVYRPHVNSAPPANSNGGNNGRRGFAPAHYQTINSAQPVNRTNYGNAGGSGAANSDADRNRNNGNGNDRGANTNNDRGANTNNDRGANTNNDRGANNGNDRGANNNNDRGANNGNDRGGNTNNDRSGNTGNNGNRNGWNNRPATEAPVNNPAANNPPANYRPANNPANNPPANYRPANNPANNPPANYRPANTPPANTPPANIPPVNNPRANTPPANTRDNRPTTFPGAPSGQVNNPNNARPGRSLQPSQPNGQQPTTSGRQPQGRSNTQPPNANQPRPVASGPKPAPPQQRPPHPPGKPEDKPDNKP